MAWFLSKAIEIIYPSCSCDNHIIVIFALAHLPTSSPVIVLYDLFFVFVNSILYVIDSLFQRV